MHDFWVQEILLRCFDMFPIMKNSTADLDKGRRTPLK